MGATGTVAVLANAKLCRVYVCVCLCVLCVRRRSRSTVVVSGRRTRHTGWWDAFVLDFLICNGGGLIAGQYLAKWLEMHSFDWVGAEPKRALGVRGKVKRIAQQFTPKSWFRVDCT